MPESSQSFLLHPAAFVVAGFVAAYGLYAVFAQSSSQGNLHRSNAVHRSNRGRPLPTTTSAVASGFDGLPSEESDHAGPADTELFESTIGSTEQPPNQGLRGLLYYIAEQDAKRKAYEHRGIRCEECSESPIRNVRWLCLSCPDFSLCSACEASTGHIKTHVFAKIKIPLPVLSRPVKQYRSWYPGDPRKQHFALDPDVKQHLSILYNFSEPQIDAMYDQFICLANVPWRGDPSRVRLAIDRRAFDRAVKSDDWPRPHAPNAVFDRTFAFYDTDANGLVGFAEYTSGLAYLKGQRRYESLHRAIEGYDMDGDGLVSRKDFLRLLRAKFEIQQILVRDVVECQEREQTAAAMGVLKSSQPISSIFSEHEIPLGETRQPQGKHPNVFGDLIPDDNAKAILDANDPWLDSQQEQNYAVRRTRDAEDLFDITTRFEQLVLGDPNEHTHRQLEGSGIPYAHDASSTIHRHGPLQTNNSQGTDEFGGIRHLQDQAPINQNTLWQLTEDALNQLLDPLFAVREVEDMRIERTKMERKRWSKETETIRQPGVALHEELSENSATDPLVATALRALNDGDIELLVEAKQGRSADPAFQGEIVPTDAESLAEREAALAKKPLEELLQGSGYSIWEEEDSRPRVAEASPSASSRTDVRINNAPFPLAQELLHDACDPTLPQNRPNHPPPMSSPNNPPPSSTATDGPPPRWVLEEYLKMNEEQRRLDQRGGLGRLTYDEIESIANADATKQLRGLIKSWLEYAIL